MPSVTKDAIKLICTAPGVAWSASPIEGSAGRYMSIEKGPTAVMSPSTIAMRKKEVVTKRISLVGIAREWRLVG